MTSLLPSWPAGSQVADCGRFGQCFDACAEPRISKCEQPWRPGSATFAAPSTSEIADVQTLHAVAMEGDEDFCSRRKACSASPCMATLHPPPLGALTLDSRSRGRPGSHLRGHPSGCLNPGRDQREPRLQLSKHLMAISSRCRSALAPQGAILLEPQVRPHLRHPERWRPLGRQEKCRANRCPMVECFPLREQLLLANLSRRQDILKNPCASHRKHRSGGGDPRIRRDSRPGRQLPMSWRLPLQPSS